MDLNSSSAPLPGILFFIMFLVSVTPEILENPTMSSYHLSCLCSGLCSFCLTPCHPHPLPNTPVLVNLSKLHFAAEQPSLATECHCFPSRKTTSSASPSHLSFFSIAASTSEFFTRFASACAKLYTLLQTRTHFICFVKHPHT